MLVSGIDLHIGLPCVLVSGIDLHIGLPCVLVSDIDLHIGLLCVLVSDIDLHIGLPGVIVSGIDLHIGLPLQHYHRAARQFFVPPWDWLPLFFDSTHLPLMWTVFFSPDALLVRSTKVLDFFDSQVCVFALLQQLCSRLQNVRPASTPTVKNDPDH